MFVHICMLTQVYELHITQLHIFSINFMHVFSYLCCIRYLVFLVLFPSISMVFIDYTCITSVKEYSKSIRLLLNDLKLFIVVAYTIFQAHATYVTLKIALNSQVTSLTSPVYTYLHAGTCLCASFNLVYLF